MKKIIAMFTLSLLLFSGCSFLPKSDTFSSENATQIGEALLPPDILFLVKFETTDDDEYENYKTLKDIFISKGSSTEDNFFTALEGELEPYEISYKDDIKPLFGERTERIVAIGGDFNNNNPDIYLVQKLDNLEKYTEIIDKLISQKAITAIEDGYKSSSSAGTEIFFGQRNGYLVLTNDQDNFTYTINLNATESLIYSKNYVKVRENLPATFLGLAYFNADLLLDEIKGLLEENQQNIDESISTTLNSPLADLILSLGTTINAEEEGIKFLGYAQGNQESMDELGFKFDEIYNRDVYLDNALPGKGLYFYLEAFDFKQKVEQFEENLQQNNTEAFELYETQKLQLKNTLGLNLQEDILTWLDKSIALSIQDTQTLIPGITIAIDVSSNPEGAGKLINTLDSFISIALLSLQEYAIAINKEEIEIGNSKFKQITILPENLPLEVQEQGDLVVPILADLKISYGITDNNIMIFTTYPNIVEDFGKDVVSENINYKQVSNKIDKKGQGVMYFSPTVFIDHVNTIVEVNQKYSSVSASDQEQIELLNDFFKPFKGLIFTNIAHKDSYEAQGYLKIK